MALSMDEQRILAEIERRLVEQDPRLAARLSAFRRPGPAAGLRSPKARVIAGIFSVALAAVISLTVYAMLPLRAHTLKAPATTQSTSQASAHPGASVQSRAAG